MLFNQQPHAGYRLTIRHRLRAGTFQAITLRLVLCGGYVCKASIRGCATDLLHHKLQRTSHSRHQFLAANSPPPPSRPHLLPSSNMTHQSEAARFQALFEPALQAYEKKTGVSLAHHPLAIKLQSCDNVEAITSGKTSGVNPR